MPLLTGVLLATLVVIPLWLRSHTENLRERVTDIALPARNALLEVQNAFASELAAIRGFELTGDTLFLADFREGLERDRVATDRLLEIAPKLGPEAAAAVAQLHGRKQAWLAEPNEALEGRRTREELIRSLSEGERRVDLVLAASDTANLALTRAEGRMRRTVADDERSASILISLLALVALAVTGVVGWLVHRLNLLADELREERSEAVSAVHYRDQMLRVVSHDLKNPLHTIGMIAEVLATTPLGNEERVRQLEIVTRTVQRMSRLIHDLLDAARVQSRHALVISPAPVRTHDLIDEVREEALPQARESNITLEITDEDAPETINVDHDRMLQVFANLIGNAIKFTPEGGRISVSAQRGDGGAAVFSIADTGSGIPAENLSHLFEPFWQAQDRASLGTGLGLSITRGIIEAHHGTVTVESIPGEGTTFRITLPPNP